MSDNNFFDEMYERWIDEVSRMPLRNNNANTRNVARALEINNQLIQNLYSIRRHLEMQDYEYEYELPNLPRFQINEFFTMMHGMFEEIINNRNNTANMEDVKVVMMEEDFNKLPSRQIEEIETEKKECNVCIEAYRKGDYVIELPCKHLFHKECIKQWLCKEKINCPVCRHDPRNVI
jgi:hypothetical protein